jgi:hypothetical protein
VDDILLLDAPWPDDLDPATVPFRKRSVTILRRMGFFDDWSLFDTLTEDHVLSWINAGAGTVVDIRDTGNAAIPRHHDEVVRRRRFEADLVAVSKEPWARHIWYRDPRFGEYLPKGDGTIYDTATSGSDDERRCLWDSREALREAVAAQAALTLSDAVAQYVGALTGRRGDRLQLFLARLRLDGRDGMEALQVARQLGVTRRAVYRGERALVGHIARARPPAGAWMLQVGGAERDGWPDGYTEKGVEATSGFFALFR